MDPKHKTMYSEHANNSELACKNLVSFKGSSMFFLLKHSRIAHQVHMVCQCLQVEARVKNVKRPSSNSKMVLTY